MISQNEFYNRIQNLPKKIPSITGKAFYTNFVVDNDMLHFTRVNTGQKWSLKISVLFQVYKSNSFINTAVVKATTNGKVNSPSVAVLKAIDCIDELGNRLHK